MRLYVSISLLVCGIVLFSLVVTDILISNRVAERAEQTMSEKAMIVARMIANTPLIIQELERSDDQGEIQRVSTNMVQASGVDFIVVMDMDGTRRSHPDPERIGEHFAGGDEGPVLNGQEYVSVAKGTLGMSLRSFAPIFNLEGKQIGAVAVGIFIQDVEQAISEERKSLLLGILMGGVIGVLGALYLARRIKKVLIGLEPKEIAKLLKERSAILNSTKEGIVAVDENLQITLANDEAKRIFKKSQKLLDEHELIGKPIGTVIEDSQLDRVLESGTADVDAQLQFHGLSLLVNRVPVVVEGKAHGAILTFRDKTEMRQITEQLTGITIYAEALRAQTHEFMNKLHVILGMVQFEFYDDLQNYIQKVTEQYQEEMGFIIRRIQEPVLAGFLLGKMSYARESGAILILEESSWIPDTLSENMIHEIITIMGNLIDNALDAVKETSVREVTVKVEWVDEKVVLLVQDTGKGMNEETLQYIFNKGYSTHGFGRGLGLHLVQERIQQLKGKLEVTSTQGKGTKFTLSWPAVGREEGRS
ncbi:DcuS/MalK family sensor histidine kinase [Ammoniphilus sp. YIM 78166]|uniref:DcuS/MalK family sensor histidine kinase n=1 Tax=Ammoniphilus sp. YIM 78166 TaxID=1644106 RepID=UPI00106F7DF0|nr:DcuS/MalK family sensor histidine kinase [Ammoniphilus sp. YIM 78166]